MIIAERIPGGNKYREQENLERKSIRLIDNVTCHVVEFSLIEWSISSICKRLNKDLGWNRKDIKNAIKNIQQ